MATEQPSEIVARALRPALRTSGSGCCKQVREASRTGSKMCWGWGVEREDREDRDV